MPLLSGTSSSGAPLFDDDAARLGRDIVDQSVAHDVVAIRSRLREL